MSESEHQFFQEQQRSNWVRLRTLVVLRWFAIAGQITAIVAATRIYDLQVEIASAALIIGSSIVANLFSMTLYPENKRLSERETTMMLLFDIVQLSLLLFLTGGLNNPFALLILAPVTIAATVLRLQSMVLVGVIAIILISIISQVNVPLHTSDGTVLVLPVIFQFGFWVSLVIGVIFLAIYARQVTTEMHTMGDALVATQLALAREQKLTDLGGVVAAAAHELGTPLATIKLVSSELIEELESNEELRDDARLIREQAERCREILLSMGRAGNEDMHLRTAPLETVIHEAAEPHIDRGKQVLFDIAPDEAGDHSQPVIPRRPEIIHGLRNLIQNAVDFAEARVEIDINWSEADIRIRITDDGPGFPQSVIGRIGDPFVRRRRVNLDGPQRPEYEGMGLGLFIAKTLLERSGAQITFENGRRHGHAGWAGQATGGAIVTVTWPREVLDQQLVQNPMPLGKNKPITL